MYERSASIESLVGSAEHLKRNNAKLEFPSKRSFLKLFYDP